MQLAVLDEGAYVSSIEVPARTSVASAPRSRAQLPLYPGETCWIEYRYAVGEDKWGRWFSARSGCQQNL